MDELEQIKQQWQQLSARTASLEEANRRMASRLAGSNITSLQQRLATRISRIGWVGFLMPAIAPLLYYVLEFPWWVALIYGIMGLVMGAITLSIGEYIRARNLTDLPVAQAIERATKIRIFQNRARIFGIILATALLTCIILSLPSGPEREPIVIGGSAGIATGLAIGVRNWIVTARYTRRLIECLKD